MFRFYEMWASLVFVAVLGSCAMTSFKQNPLNHFKEFHDCLSNISLNSSNFGCILSEDCLEIMFNASEKFLESNMETVKLGIQNTLDSLKHDCSSMFTEARKTDVTCQTEQISICLRDSETLQTNMCRKLKNLAECIRHLTAKCSNGHFASIVRSLSTGIWDNSHCVLGLGEIVEDEDVTETGTNNTLEGNQSLQIQHLVVPLSRNFEDTFSNDTNSSFPTSRQGIAEIPILDQSLENVTVEAPTTTGLPNSATIGVDNYLLLLLPVITSLIFQLVEVKLLM